MPGISTFAFYEEEKNRSGVITWISRRATKKGGKWENVPHVVADVAGSPLNEMHTISFTASSQQGMFSDIQVIRKQSDSQAAMCGVIKC